MTGGVALESIVLSSLLNTRYLYLIRIDEMRFCKFVTGVRVVVRCVYFIHLRPLDGYITMKQGTHFQYSLQPGVRAGPR